MNYAIDRYSNEIVSQSMQYDNTNNKHPSAFYPAIFTNKQKCLREKKNDGWSMKYSWHIEYIIHIIRSGAPSLAHLIPR